MHTPRALWSSLSVRNFREAVVQTGLVFIAEEDGGGVVYEAGEELAPIEEKSSIEMIPENPTAEILRETTSSGPGGIHIHVEQV
jgi:hypothetical protein